MQPATEALQDFFKNLELENDEWSKVSNTIIPIVSHPLNEKFEACYRLDGFVSFWSSNPQHFNDYEFWNYDHPNIYQIAKKEHIKPWSYKQAQINEYQKYVATKLYEISPQLAAEYKNGLIEHINNKCQPEIDALEIKLKGLKENLNKSISRVKAFPPVETNKPNNHTKNY